jgi:glycosyltransferase involved in cell wall biosynthesis
MENRERPLVSVGVPVFNGEGTIGRALDGLLAQDYPHLEIVISDNGSTDGTRAICERYARADSRVRLFGSARNRGAIWNFNRVFELSRGAYFMWAAHDDLREPTYVSACVEALERDPDAVLCQSHTAVSIGGRDDTLFVADLDTFESVTGVVDRYRETLNRVPATVVYGLYRTSAMRKTQLWRETIGNDVAFVLELSIHGRFIQVPRVLFRYRARETWSTVDDDARTVLARGSKPWWYLPFVALFADHTRRLALAPVPVGTKARLFTVLSAYEATRLARRLVIKVAGRCCPAPRREWLGRVIYRRWLQNPNVTVVDHDLFMARVCKPQIGWWS